MYKCDCTLPYTQLLLVYVGHYLCDLINKLQSLYPRYHMVGLLFKKRGRSLVLLGGAYQIGAAHVMGLSCLSSNAPS